MSEISPSEHYYKSRRFCVLVSGLLLLALLIGIKPVESTNTIFSFTLEKPEYLTKVFFVISLYSIWQFWSNWYLQNVIVRSYWINKVDFIITLAIAAFSIVIFLNSYIKIEDIAFTVIENFELRKEIVRPILIVLAALISGLIGYFSSNVSKIKNSNIRKLSNKEFKLYAALTNPNFHWWLHYNVKNPEAKKHISLGTNGEILEGKNKNENTWRINNGFLEFLNNQRQVFSRFDYNENSGKFIHTNDNDTLSLKNQILYPLNKI